MRATTNTKQKESSAMKKMMTLLAVFGLVLALAPASAQAQSIFAEFLYTPYGYPDWALYVDYCRDIRFIPDADVRVTHLGRCDANNDLSSGDQIGAPDADPDNWGDGLTTEHTVQLLKTSDSSVIAEVVIGPSTTLYDTGFRWEALTSPVTLEAGVEYTLKSPDPNYNVELYPNGNGIPSNFNSYYGTHTYSQNRCGDVNLATTPIPPAGTVFIIK